MPPGARVVMILTDVGRSVQHAARCLVPARYASGHVGSPALTTLTALLPCSLCALVSEAVGGIDVFKLLHSLQQVGLKCIFWPLIER